ncbi:MAG: amino acid permease, partial [Rhodobacteraceae bacterium]|nr:amino acid permease [Paracoccaceae bacterium]
LLWETATGRSAAFLSAIAVFAAVNGVLAQIVMAARVLFGLGRRAGWLGAFHHAHPRFGTPVLATLLVGTALIGAALALPVAALAEATAVVLLAVFVLVNIAAIRIKRRAPAAPFRVPGFVPWAGLVAAALALVAAGGAFG